MANLPGYETTFITRSELSDDGLKALQDRLSGVIGSFGGEIVLTEDWGKKKLSYPIKKETRGHYSYLVYTGKGQIVHEIERNLRLNEHVLRFLTVNLEKEFEGETFKKQRSDAHAAAKRRELAREQQYAERYGRTGGSSDKYDDKHFDEAIVEEGVVEVVEHEIKKGSEG